MSKQAHYHQFERQPALLDVAKEHADGTVDLARDGAVVVSRCPIATAPKPGHATLAPDPKAEAEKAKAEADKGGKK